MQLCPLIAKWTLPPDGYFECPVRLYKRGGTETWLLVLFDFFQLVKRSSNPNNATPMMIVYDIQSLNSLFFCFKNNR